MRPDDHRRKWDKKEFERKVGRDFNLFSIFFEFTKNLP